LYCITNESFYESILTFLHPILTLSTNTSYSNEGEFTNKVITLWYRPPELLLGETRYGTAVDIWSAGCILAEIILGRPIFTGKTEMDQLKLIFDLIGTPTKNTWDGFNELKLIRTGEVSIEKVKRPKLREKYGGKIQPVSGEFHLGCVVVVQIALLCSDILSALCLTIASFLSIASSRITHSIELA
jgi:serine/threonine protein kinase